MAKISMKARGRKRAKLAARYKSKRTNARKVRNSIHSSPEEKAMAQAILQGLKRNSAPTRERKCCFVCGRPRGYVGRFGLCRIHLRDALRAGLIPGLKLASW